MMNHSLKDALFRLLPRVQTPAQYIGGELNSVVKGHRQVRGKLVLAFPDAYTLGMSHHGLQVLYTLINNDPRWACERAFTPWIDFEAELRRRSISSQPVGRSAILMLLASASRTRFATRPSSLCSIWASFRCTPGTAHSQIHS